jgi:hypothetical protein
MTFIGTTRPRPRWHHAQTKLDDFAIVSFRVSAEALARHLPAGFAPTEMRFSDGPGAMISAVAFQDRDFHFRCCPPVKINCGQINYRAYVSGRGEQGVWFFGTSLDHPAVMIPRRLWSMPWTRERIDIQARWSGAPASWRLKAGDTGCEAAESAEPPNLLDGFEDESHWRRLLTHPTLGWYRRRDGRVGTYGIWHPPMRPRHFAATSARFPFFERLGLITAETPPHSVLAQRQLHFDVHTPPRRLA